MEASAERAVEAKGFVARIDRGRRGLQSEAKIP
jgi:hypothetical protein